MKTPLLATVCVVLPAVSLAKSSPSCGPTPSGAIRPSLASGYHMQVVATGLSRPRGIALDRAGNLLVVEQGRGLISAHTLNESDGCVSVGTSSDVTPDISLNHGIEISDDGKTLYASSEQDVFAWSYDGATRATANQVSVVTNMSAGGHSTRSLLLSRKAPGMLAVTRGSTSNIDLQAASLDSGISQIKAFNLRNRTGAAYDYIDDGLRLGWGLRNDVGLAEHPGSGGIYSVENSVDQLMRGGVDVHQDNPAEEMNFLGYLDGTHDAQQGGNFGYPWCFSAWVVDDLPDHVNLSVGSQFAADATMDSDHQSRSDEYCAAQVPPRLVFQAHMAALDIKFNNSGAEAWITFHGSWDRTDPVGYKVSVVAFNRDGEPVDGVESKTAARDVLTNSDLSACPDDCFRPVAMAFDAQGRVYISSDSSGEIYLITKDSSAHGTPQGAASIPRASLTGAWGFFVIMASGRSSSGIIIIIIIIIISLITKYIDAMTFPGQISLTDMSAYESNASSRQRSQRAASFHHTRTKFESLPNEILIKIAIHIADDQDLAHYFETCQTFASGLAPAESSVWRERFLQRYDYPRVDELTEFIHAYHHRRFVLNNFVYFVHPKDLRLPIQLGVLRDMVIETYHQPDHRLDPPTTSRNLAMFASPQHAQWMCQFLSCTFFPKPRQRYGQPHALFGDLQLVLSHLLLSPASEMAHFIDSSRHDYDLALVYNWRKPFSTLYALLPEEEETDSTQSTRHTMFPNLRPRKPPAVEQRYGLDTYSLLHIRNFWHRHLTSEHQHAGQFRSTDLVGESTYATMAKHLAQAGIAPKPWDKPLEDGLPHIALKWYGHYSCIHPWPKRRDILDELQSNAEEWDRVEPLTLDFDTSHDNQADGFWPPIFQNIPVFRQTLPQENDCVYIRGLAPFMELKSPPGPPVPQRASLTLPTLPKFHPFLALRLRGVIHPISRPPGPQGPRDDPVEVIPGWSRIVMILYKPTTRYLIQVLEHAEENYGGQFGPIVTNQLLGGGAGGAAADEADMAQVEAGLKAYLEQKLLSNPSLRDPKLLTKDATVDMEERFRLSEYLDWNDIEAAWAYEGAVLPGGKIMMGRWWRCGLFGDGDGMELGEYGLAAELEQVNEVNDAMATGHSDPMDLDGPESGPAASSSAALIAGDEAASSDGPPLPDPSPNLAAVATHDRKMERGPFVFWC